MPIRNKNIAQSIFNKLNYLFLFVFGFSTLYPFIYFLVLSFNDGIDALKGGIYFWPRFFTLENYEKAFQNPYIMSSFEVSVFRTLVGTIFSIILTSTVAYALTKKTLPGRTGIIFYFFFTTLFSGGIIPLYILLRQLGLTKSIWIYIFPFLYNFFNMIVMKTFFDSIPKSLSESAVIDGCGDLTIYWKIYMPLSGPIIATIALFFGVGHWNDWFTGSFYITDKKLYPAATLLQQILTEATFESSGGLNQTLGNVNALLVSAKARTTPEALRMTFLIITTVPIICVYPFLQKYFVKGIMIGSIKG